MQAVRSHQKGEAVVNGGFIGVAMIPDSEAHLKIVGNMDDVTDLTTPGHFLWNTLVLLLSCISSALWSLTAFANFLLMVPAGAMLWILRAPFSYGRSFVQWVQTGKWESDITKQFSAVNIGSEQVLMDYRPDYDKLDPLLAKKEGAGTLGDIDLAIFFNILSSAVYETNWIHSVAFEQWEFDEQVRVLNTNSCSATIVKRILPDGQLALILVFKGTSPFDLNEWMSDFSMQRVAVMPELVMQYGFAPEGEMHKGFYNAFLLPPERKNGVAVPSPLELILEQCREIIREHKQSHPGFNVNTHLRVWITGHSLGAALATVFTTFVISSTNRQLDVKHLNRDGAETFEVLCRGLTGVTTFGNPRVGNKRLANFVNAALNKAKVPFRRFRNGNDIVGIAPLGTGLMQEFLEDVQTVRDGNIAPWKVTSIFDFADIGKEYRLGYLGSVWEPRSIPPHKTLSYEDRHRPFAVLHHVLYAILLRLEKLSGDAYHTFANCVLSWGLLMKTLMALVASSMRLFPPNMDPLASLVFCPTLLGVGLQCTMPTFVFDHTPSEYVKHLYLYRQNCNECVDDEGKKE